MNLSIIALLVTLLWIASLAVYIYVSRQQRDLQSGIESVQKMLEEQRDKEEQRLSE